VSLILNQKGLSRSNIFTELYIVVEPRWQNHLLSATMKRAKTREETDELTVYLTHSLSCAQSFMKGIQHKPDIKYPPLAVVRSDSWPTPVKFKASVSLFNPKPSSSLPPIISSLFSNFTSAASLSPTKPPADTIDAEGAAAAAAGKGTETTDLDSKQRSLATSMLDAWSSSPIMPTNAVLTSWLNRVRQSLQQSVESDGGGGKNGNVSPVVDEISAEVPSVVVDGGGGGGGGVVVSENVDEHPPVSSLLGQDNIPKVSVENASIDNVPTTHAVNESASENPATAATGLVDEDLAVNAQKSLDKHQPVGDNTTANSTTSSPPIIIGQDGHGTNAQLDESNVTLEDHHTNPSSSSSSSSSMTMKEPKQDQDPQKEVFIQVPAVFAPGDGVVSSASAELPDGYEYDVVLTRASHPGMMNDLLSLAKALEKVFVDKKLS
jgi:hypothetical protein